MEYFIESLKKALKSVVIITVLIVILWGMLYHLTNFSTIKAYLMIGLGICLFNTLLDSLQKKKVQKIFYVNGLWIVMAGMVLVLYHAGFEAAAVCAAAAIFASPFFGATLYEGIVGLSLLITLALLIP